MPLSLRLAEAFPGDYVCVTPDIRAQAARDNAAAADRINPTNHDYGPDTCRFGYVWREANSSDHVCVEPAVRAQAAHDNALAAGRWAGSAPASGAPVERVIEQPGNPGVAAPHIFERREGEHREAERRDRERHGGERHGGEHHESEHRNAGPHPAHGGNNHNKKRH
jgi:hypothetical protein